jgi:hypothetical protein
MSRSRMIPGLVAERALLPSLSFMGLHAFATFGLCLSAGFHSPHHLVVRILSSLGHQA